jgi:SAM-dependent methyltransferase
VKSYLQFQITVALAGLIRRIVRLGLGGDPVRAEFDAFFQRVNAMQGPKVLELGSCNYSRKSSFTSFSEYVGFDIHSGPNVDVTGDIHRLSEILPRDHFDVVFAISVFEHLAMPWKAVQEINKVLKPGGTLFIFTHHTFPLHAEPWDFWRFSKHAFPVLLNRHTGFEITGCQMGWPCLVLPLEREKALTGTHTILSYMGITVTAKKTHQTSPGMRWDLPDAGLVEGLYPLNSAPLKASNPFLDYLETRVPAGRRRKPDPGSSR